ncbi:MarR family transcriptional regulator [Rhodobacteraceae bacterium CCMM004]|nr:MarR family transcriptional regulator [Rhodobacteraceae bacterium CCMM004]
MTGETEQPHPRATSIGWLLQRAARQAEAAMEERLTDVGLSVQQFAVMMTVLEDPGLSQTEIGARFSMPAWAISRAIDHLVAEGLVERRAHPTSRRTLAIYPTEEGRALAGRLFAIVGEVNDTVSAPLTGAERGTLAALLVKLVGAGPT